MKQIDGGNEFVVERNGIKIKFYEVAGVSKNSYNMEIPENLEDIRTFLGADAFKSFINRPLEVMFNNHCKGDLDRFKLRFKQKDVRRFDSRPKKEIERKQWHDND